jgi:hypothetical protein
VQHEYLEVGASQQNCKDQKDCLLVADTNVLLWSLVPSRLMLMLFLPQLISLINSPVLKTL